MLHLEPMLIWISYLEVAITFKTQVMAVLLVIGVAFAMRAIKKSISSFDSFSRSPMPYRVEAKKNLRRIHRRLEDAFDRDNTYENAKLDFYQFKTDRYHFGDLSKLAKLKNYCKSV